MAAPKKLPNRTAKASFLLRCSEEERQLVEKAVERIQEGLGYGAKLTINGFLLDAAVEKARKVLGEK